MKIKTGHVFQVTAKGPNYIALGKTTDDAGNTIIVATKNGNIRNDGLAKMGRRIRRKASAPLKKVGNRMALYGFEATKIHNVHGFRSVDLDSVWDRGSADDLGVEVKKMTARSGVTSAAQHLS